MADTNGTLGKYEIGSPQPWAIDRNSAPDLYAALQTLIERVANYAPHMEREGDLDDARAALAKARGEASNG